MSLHAWVDVGADNLRLRTEQFRSYGSTPRSRPQTPTSGPEVSPSAAWSEHLLLSRAVDARSLASEAFLRVSMKSPRSPTPASPRRTPDDMLPPLRSCASRPFIRLRLSCSCQEATRNAALGLVCSDGWHDRWHWNPNDASRRFATDELTSLGWGHDVSSESGAHRHVHGLFLQEMSTPTLKPIKPNIVRHGPERPGILRLG